MFLRTQTEDNNVISNVYAIGDCAMPESRTLPATAQVAAQEAKYLARQFLRETRHKELQPFVFHHRGMLAYIGEDKAVADLPAGKVFNNNSHITTIVLFSCLHYR